MTDLTESTSLVDLPKIRRFSRSAPATETKVERSIVMYLRQSKDVAKDGLAIARQREACEALAARRGWTVARVFIDNDVSATASRRRPAYDEMIALAERGEVGTVIVWAVDRLTRRLTDLEDLIEKCERYQLKVCTVDGDIDLSTDSGRLVGRILASVARGEMERKSKRQKLESTQAALAGDAPKRRAFGYNLDGTVHDVEGPILAEVYALIVAGTSGNGAVRWLNDREVRTIRGKRWSRNSLAATISNPRYMGYRVLRGEVVARGNWEPLVNEATWRAAVDQITDPSLQGRRTGRRWLGSATYFCGVCGEKVHVNYINGGVRVYQCKRPGAAKHLSRSAEAIDAYVEEEMERWLGDAERLASFLEPDDADRVTPLLDEKRALVLRLDQIGLAVGDGEMTPRQAHLATERVQARLLEVERGLAEAGRGNRLAAFVGAEKPVELWRDMKDLSERQAVLNAVMRVTILRGAPGRRPFDPATVRIEPVVPGG